MAKVEKSPVVADLRTAQNSMFQFVVDHLQSQAGKEQLATLLKDQDNCSRLYQEVRSKLFSLLHISKEQSPLWHIGIFDSGKRAIESLVSYFCPPESGVNIAVNTENYVAFNKFSAVSSLKSQKGVEFLKPFKLQMGQALTVGSPKELKKAEDLIRKNSAKTLWIAWNSTSTGIIEQVQELVAFRNSCSSDTLIISDAASLPLFTKNWKDIDSTTLPDVFFFSLRKQGIPYDGPQDEANQAKNSGSIYIFNQRALARALAVNGPSLYDTPRPEEAAEYIITSGEQRTNHLKHLVKLDCCLNTLLENNTQQLQQQDQIRKIFKQNIDDAFATGSDLTEKGFRLVANPRAQSETSYIVRVPESIKPKDLIAKLKQCGVEVSLSMHPELSGKSHFRFACYPATTQDEANIAVNSFRQCMV